MAPYIYIYLGVGFFVSGYVAKDAEGEGTAGLLWAAILFWPLMLMFSAGYRLRKMLD